MMGRSVALTLVAAFLLSVLPAGCSKKSDDGPRYTGTKPLENKKPVGRPNPGGADGKANAKAGGKSAVVD
jgi:hypothetical protein